MDSNLFYRVIDNLVSNALKFSPSKGTVTLQIEYPSVNEIPSALPETVICIRVLDEGPGIPPEHHDSIFDKHEIAKLKNSGVSQVGLGLAFCKLVVDAHGGQITVANNLRGLFLRLHFEETDYHIMEYQSTILIVDDESVGRDTLEALLFNKGYRLVFASDGKEALAKAIELKPDVILLDVILPKKDAGGEKTLVGAGTPGVGDHIACVLRFLAGFISRLCVWINDHPEFVPIVRAACRRIRVVEAIDGMGLRIGQ